MPFRVITLKSPKDLRGIAEVASQLADLLKGCYNLISTGISAVTLEKYVNEFCVSNNTKSAFRGYNRYPYSLSVSINNEVVQGLPENKLICYGDIVSVDAGLVKNGFYADAAFTKIVGGWAHGDVLNLCSCVNKCLLAGIEKAVVGNRILDISKAIEITANNMGCAVIKDFMGHGTGFDLHEFPRIPNYVYDTTNYKLQEGMVIAIEPIIVSGSGEIYRDMNGWTILTKDDSWAAQAEHTIVITKLGPIILTDFIIE